ADASAAGSIVRGRSSQARLTRGTSATAATGAGDSSRIGDAGASVSSSPSARSHSGRSSSPIREKPPAAPTGSLLVSAPGRTGAADGPKSGRVARSHSGICSPFSDSVAGWTVAGEPSTTSRSQGGSVAGSTSRLESSTKLGPGSYRAASVPTSDAPHDPQ